MSAKISKRTSFQIDHTHHLYKITDRIEQGHILRPLGHTADRGKKTTQLRKDDQEEESGKHSLLLRRRYGRNSQPKARKSNQVDSRKQINDPHISDRDKAIHDPSHDSADRQQDKADNPEGYQFR